MDRQIVAPASRLACRLVALSIAVTVTVLLVPAQAISSIGASYRSASSNGACREAIAQAEDLYTLPGGLLRAIGTTESGRPDTWTGTVEPWPWTVNADGRGSYYESQGEAIAAVLQLQAQGVRSIDVGCMQVNLMAHPRAFATLEQAFDPVGNADYAARLLLSLYGETTGWMGAAMAYHSRTSDIAAPYGARVAATWNAQAGMTDGMTSDNPRSAPGSGDLAGMGASAPVVFQAGTAFPVALPNAFRAIIVSTWKRAPRNAHSPAYSPGRILGRIPGRIQVVSGTSGLAAAQ